MANGAIEDGPAGGTMARGRPQVVRPVDVIGIGGTKCGSTSLWAVLRAQPWFAPCAVKESNYFGLQHHRGPDWYAGLFPARAPGVLTGEVTPAYLTHPDAPGRIRAHSPAARLIVVLRDPVRRFASHVAMNQGAGRLDADESVADVLASDRRLRMRSHLLDLGEYSRHLRRFLEHFPREQLRVLFLEELRAEPSGLLGDLLAWLAPGKVSHVPERLPHWNPAFRPMSVRVDTALRRMRATATARGAMRRVDRIESARRLLSRPVPATAAGLDPDVERILRQHYHRWNADLEELLRRPIPSEWTR